jgi:hypothetical protein
MRVAVLVSMFGAVAVLSGIPLDAHACGESLFRVGGPHRAQTAPLPGNVLFVVPSIETNVLYVEAIALADRLEAAGHTVRVIQSASLINDELQKAKYDVVLAAYDDRKIVAAKIAGTTTKYVPIATADSQKELVAASYERYVSCTDDFREFLRVIHRSLRAP